VTARSDLPGFAEGRPVLPDERAEIALLLAAATISSTWRRSPVADSTSAAAISLAVSSTGAFAHLETHELIPADQIQDVLDRAKSARGQYAARPGPDVGSR